MQKWNTVKSFVDRNNSKYSVVCKIDKSEPFSHAIRWYSVVSIYETICYFSVYYLCVCVQLMQKIIYLYSADMVKFSRLFQNAIISQLNGQEANQIFICLNLFAFQSKWRIYLSQLILIWLGWWMSLNTIRLNYVSFFFFKKKTNKWMNERSMQLSTMGWGHSPTWSFYFKVTNGFSNKRRLFKTATTFAEKDKLFSLVGKVV